MSILKTMPLPILVLLISGCIVQDRQRDPGTSGTPAKPDAVDIITSEEYGTPPELESRTTGATVTEEIPRKVRSYQEPVEEEQEPVELEEYDQE